MGQAAKRRCPGRKSKLFFSLARAGLSDLAYLRLLFLTNQKKRPKALLSVGICSDHSPTIRA